MALKKIFHTVTVVFKDGSKFVETVNSVAELVASLSRHFHDNVDKTEVKQADKKEEQKIV
ncbi:MAG: hypothetical protein JWQ09_1143 [Segetibacter sp.]|nr:hypothetical protein [Segetibacter sp.]